MSEVAEARTRALALADGNPGALEAIDKSLKALGDRPDPQAAILAFAQGLEKTGWRGSTIWDAYVEAKKNARNFITRVELLG